MQTLKLFNDAKFCEDEKGLENTDNTKSNINKYDSNKIESNFATNAANKKSLKELVPIPNRKNIRDYLSPKNKAIINNSFQTSGN